MRGPCLFGEAELFYMINEQLNERENKVYHIIFLISSPQFIKTLIMIIRGCRVSVTLISFFENENMKKIFLS